MNRTPENGIDRAAAERTGWLSAQQPLLAQLFAQSGAASWRLQRDVFAAAVEISARKRFGEKAPHATQLQEYVSALHLRDLALACACAGGCTEAWDYFVASFRGYLRSAAGAILRCPRDSPAACEFADSLFAELYGVSEGANRRSLFRYFHGRSSLKTWLRAVLAQRHVDAIRAGRKFEELEDEDGRDNPKLPAAARELQVADPHRARYLLKFANALQTALANLDARDIELLRMYYAEQKKLAEIGRGL